MSPARCSTLVAFVLEQTFLALILPRHLSLSQRIGRDSMAGGEGTKLLGPFKIALVGAGGSGKVSNQNLGRQQRHFRHFIV